MLKKVLVIVLLVTAALVAFAAYSGLFSSVAVEEKTMGPFTAACAEHRGSYSKIGPVLDRVNGALEKEFGLRPTRGIGIFYDKPGVVGEENLRSAGGCVLEGDGLDRRDELGKKFKIIEVPEGKYVTVVLPYRNAFSFVAGAMKAYGAMGRHVSLKKYKDPPFGVEIYDMKGGTITYLMPIVK